MEKKLDRRIVKTKTSIKNAFISLMDKKDLSQITVTELSSLADIDRKTFYLHYDTVIDVYKEIVADASSRLQLLLEQQDSFSFDSFFHGLNQIMKNNLDFYQIIVKKESYSHLLNEHADLLACKLTEKYQSEEQSISIQRSIQIAYFSAGVIGVYTKWLKKEIGISLDELAYELSKETSHFLEM